MLRENFFEELLWKELIHFPLQCVEGWSGRGIRWEVWEVLSAFSLIAHSKSFSVLFALLSSHSHKQQPSQFFVSFLFGYFYRHFHLSFLTPEFCKLHILFLGFGGFGSGRLFSVKEIWISLWRELKRKFTCLASIIFSYWKA